MESWEESYNDRQEKQECKHSFTHAKDTYRDSYSNEYRLIKDNERVHWLFLYIKISWSN